MMRCLVNPLCLFLGVWGAATILYLSGVLAGTFPAPRPLTVEALLLNLGTFSLGYLTWSLFQSLPRPADPERLLSDNSWDSGARCRPLTRTHLVRALQFTLLAGIAALLMELYRLSVLASYFNTSWPYLVTHPAVFRLRLVTFIASNLFETSPTVMLLSLTNSFFSIGFILLGLFLYTDRTRWRYVYLSAFLLISLAIALMHLSRYEMTANILYLVLTYGFVSARDRSAPGAARGRLLYAQLLLPLAAIALLFLAIDLLLRKSTEFAQASRLEGFLYHLYWYIASPLAAFNEFLTTSTGGYELGQNMFFPLYKWLCRFHLAQPGEFSIYGEKVYIPFVANTYTYLRNFYEDFGLLGVTLAPYALGWLMAALQRSAARYFPYLNLYVVLLTFLLFSFYNYFLTSSQLYLQILFGFVFFRFDLAASHEARV
jgi:oligosaccharide repeat unit polymerase